MSERSAAHTASRLRWRWRRIKGGWRCALDIHRWRGHRDAGDEVNVMPISGYRRPQTARDWRVCDWCGAHSVAVRGGDDRMRFFFWGRPHRG